MKARKKQYRRSRTKVIESMLKASLLGTTKTRLMYRTGLNYTNFVEYLSKLLEHNLIKRVQLSNQGIIYKTTTEGKEVLKALKEAERHIDL